MDSIPPWKSLLRTPQPRDHLIQLYTDTTFLAAAVTHFVESGFASGEAAVIIATPTHVELFAQALTARGHDVSGMMERRQLVTLDAEACLSRFMVDGLPDPAAFRSLAADTLDRVRMAGYAGIRLYGEMVNLLWNHNLEATVRLEALWDDVVAEQQVSLLCAYRIDPFDHHVYRGLLHRITLSHSYLIPVDDYERFDRAVDRAFNDVFGSRGDAETLRTLFASRSDATAVMPPAQAALFALHELPSSVGAAVLDRARHHYGDASPLERQPSTS